MIQGHRAGPRVEGGQIGRPKVPKAAALERPGGVITVGGQPELRDGLEGEN